MPFKELFSSLIMLILPTALGMWVRWRWPKAEHFMKKIIVPFTLLTVLFIFTAGIYINLFIFLLMTPTMVLAGFTIAIAGYVFGASLAWVFGLPRGQIIAVAIETSFQNASIAFILLKISLPAKRFNLLRQRLELEYVYYISYRNIVDMTSCCYVQRVGLGYSVASPPLGPPPQMN